MSPLAVPTSSLHLSWNSARLLALVLNSLTGLLRFYGNEQNTFGPDDIFALHVLNSQLDSLGLRLENHGYHKEIYAAMRNLSGVAGELATKRFEKWHSKNLKFGNAIESLLVMRPARVFVPMRRIDERLRWSVKDHVKSDDASRKWFDQTNIEECWLLLADREKGCQWTPACSDKFATARTTNGYRLSGQVLTILLTSFSGCESQVDRQLQSAFNNSLTEFVVEFCTNLHFELDVYRRDKRKLARIDRSRLDLLAEQMFVCGQFGFVEFADTHFLVALLSWQHPKLGCFASQRPESFPNMGLTGDLPLEKQSESHPEDTCVNHLSSVVTVALVTALRFLLEPNPWPEYRSAPDHLVTIDKIVAEDQFHVFRYIEWVRDAAFPTGMRPPQPPPVAWAPDLIAFMALLFILLTGSVLAHSFCTSNNPHFRLGRAKPLYHFAYKKL